MYRQDNSKQLMKDPSTASSRIYIGNLNENVNNQEVESHFFKYGKILGVLLHKGFGFIQFETEQSATEAIKMEHQSNFHGRNLIVRRAQSNVGNMGPNNPFNNPQDNPRSGRPMDSPQFGDSRAHGRHGDMSRVPPPGRNLMQNPPNRLPPIRDRSPIESRNMFGPMNTKPLVKPLMEGENTDRNDCEIIVLSKALTKYAELIESKLLDIGLTVDLLYPNEDVPIRRVLANISSRGCIYAILVLPQNQEHHSLTLNILHGAQQEHRNILLSDAITLLKNDFEALYNRGTLQRIQNVPFAKNKHPDSIHTMISILASNRMLTVLQYDKLIRYLQDCREDQVKVELGDCSDVPLESTQTKTQQELQQRILSILNKPPESNKPAIPDVSITPQWNSPQVSSKQPPNTPLLYDPTVQKALDSLMQGNLLQNMGVKRFC